MIHPCPHCSARNRVPVRHLADSGRCGACKQELAAIREPLGVDSRLFLEITAGATVPVLVDFWAPWCGPCNMVSPEVAKAAANLAGKAIVVKVNTEDNPELAGQFEVRSIPNFALFCDGELKWQQPGALGHRQLEEIALGQT